MHFKDPYHHGIKSIHICSSKLDFYLTHLEHQNKIQKKGNEKYFDSLNREIRWRQFFLNGEVCGCSLCSGIYKLFGRTH